MGEKGALSGLSVFRTIKEGVCPQIGSVSEPIDSYSP